MANYNVDISVAIRNTNKLTAFNKQLDKTAETARRARQGLSEISQTAKSNLASLSNLSNTLREAQRAFNKTVLGTKASVLAARDLASAERMVNKELKERTALMNKFRFQGGGSAFKSFSQKADKIPSPNVLTVSQQKSIDRHNRKDRDKHLKNIDKKVAKIATIQTQQQSQKAFAALPGGTFGMPGGQIGPRLPLANRLGFGRNAQAGPFAMQGGAMGRLKGGAGSAMIGGGFPLLFGAGGLSSIMGGVAGGLGGALAPGGGFAASIAATALAAQIEKVRAFRKEVRKLNEDVASMGIVSTFSRQQIKDLAKEFDITNDEAIKLAATFKTFGADQAGTLLSAFGSREIFDSLSGLRDTESVLGKIQELSGNISEETRRELLQTLATEGSLKTQQRLQEEIINVRRKAAVDKKMDQFNFDDVFKNNRGNFKKAFDTEIERTEFRLKKQKEFNEEFDKTNETAGELLENQIQINEQMQFLSEFNAPTDELRELLTPMRQVLDLSSAIKTGFEDSFRGIIKGTMSVQDAFRSMLNRITDHFIDMAAQMAALQIQKGFLSLFSNMFNFTSLGDVQGSFMPSNPNFRGARAEGGPVKGGKSYLVGERGPEMFSPGVSGMITPNHALGGSTNIVVNVDASGSNVEGDEEQGRELGRLISVAVQSEIIQQRRPGGLLA